jgi:hypothetical protein
VVVWAKKEGGIASLSGLKARGQKETDLLHLVTGNHDWAPRPQLDTISRIAQDPAQILGTVKSLLLEVRMHLPNPFGGSPFLQTTDYLFKL